MRPRLSVLQAGSGGRVLTVGRVSTVYKQDIYLFLGPFPSYILGLPLFISEAKLLKQLGVHHDGLGRDRKGTVSWERALGRVLLSAHQGACSDGESTALMGTASVNASPGQLSLDPTCQAQGWPLGTCSDHWVGEGGTISTGLSFRGWR